MQTTSTLKRLALNFYFWIFLAFGVSFTFALVNKWLDPVQKHNTVVSDGKGYYAYLPGMFIYDDINFGFNQTVEKDKHTETAYTDYRYKIDKKRVYTRYYLGTCIAYAPFFFGAHFTSLAMGWDADGYTAIYHGSIVLAAICYAMLAMIFFGKVFDLYGIKYWVKVFVILGVYFGSNWFYYACWESSLSHTYSVAFVALFWYYALRFKENPTVRLAIVIGLLVGFITLIRPVNVLVVLFLPMLFTSWSIFWKFFTEKILNWKIVASTLLASGAVVSLQLFVYKAQIGQWFIYAYSQERFYFLDPHMFDFLFSFRKGFFVYTPIFILSVLGLYSWYKKGKFQALWWLGTFVLITYIFSSWHMWWYGGTYGTRVFIEYYLFLALPLALWLTQLRGVTLKIVMTIACLFIFNNVLQQYQYRKGILHYEAMTWDMYKDIFLYPIVP